MTGGYRAVKVAQPDGFDSSLLASWGFAMQAIMAGWLKVLPKAPHV
jgi:hypothetical protein